MSTLTHRVHDTIAPTAQESLIAEQSYMTLFEYAHDKKMPGLKIIAGDHREVEIPSKAIDLLMDILEEMAAGHSVTITSIHTELTTQEAADLLNVSRPYLVSLLEQSKIPHRKVGTKRRVHAEDILAYKAAIEAKRFMVLEELASEAQKLNLGY